MIPKILGVDFDDTIFTGGYPTSEKPNWPIIDYIKTRQAQGWYTILVTCRHSKDDVKEAIAKCEDVGIRIDLVNENHPEVIEKFGDCRKIFCNEYIDDKNLSVSEIEHRYWKVRARMADEWSRAT